MARGKPRFGAMRERENAETAILVEAIEERELRQAARVNGVPDTSLKVGDAENQKSGGYTLVVDEKRYTDALVKAWRDASESFVTWAKGTGGRATPVWNANGEVVPGRLVLRVPVGGKPKAEGYLNGQGLVFSPWMVEGEIVEGLRSRTAIDEGQLKKGVKLSWNDALLIVLNVNEAKVREDVVRQVIKELTSTSQRMCEDERPMVEVVNGQLVTRNLGIKRLIGYGTPTQIV